MMNFMVKIIQWKCFTAKVFENHRLNSKVKKPWTVLKVWGLNINGHACCVGVCVCVHYFILKELFKIRINKSVWSMMNQGSLTNLASLFIKHNQRKDHFIYIIHLPKLTLNMRE